MNITNLRIHVLNSLNRLKKLKGDGSGTALPEINVGTPMPKVKPPKK